MSAEAFMCISCNCDEHELAIFYYGSNNMAGDADVSHSQCNFESGFVLFKSSRNASGLHHNRNNRILNENTGNGDASQRERRRDDG
jgi:hypothetical protein